MRSHRGLIAAICVVVLSVSACGSSGTTKAPSQSALATPSQAATASPSPSGSAGESTFYLRWWTTTLGPAEDLANAPVVISDGKLLAVNYPEEAETYPLYVSPTSRTLTAAAIATIIDEARSDGLLGEKVLFECPHDASSEPMTGSGVSNLLLTVDGETHQLTASCAYAQPTPAGNPQPATWEAYQRFEHLISDPVSWLGSAIGAETPYDPQSLAVLAMPLPDEVDVPDNPEQWPLGPFSSFGSSYSDGARCAMVTGPDVAALLAVIKPLPQDAVFVDDNNDPRILVVRALMPGEPDLCGS
jgi:hypothetical protein